MDEALVRNVPGLPCCPPERPKPRWHVIDFNGVAAGARVPVSQAFSDSSSTLRWSGFAARRRPGAGGRRPCPGWPA